MGKGRSPVAQKRGRANCLPRQRTLLLASDPFRRAHAQTHAHTHLLHPNSLRHCPSPSCPMQAGWTLTSAAATFLQREGGARGGKEGREEEGERARERQRSTTNHCWTSLLVCSSWCFLCFIDDEYPENASQAGSLISKENKGTKGSRRTCSGLQMLHLVVFAKTL